MTLHTEDTTLTPKQRRFRVHPIKPRKMNFPFGTHIAHHWFSGSPFLTHLVNGVNLLFPEGERFFIRSIRPFLDRIDDPELYEQARGFMAQEVRHGIEHERFFATLEAQGYDIASFVDMYTDESQRRQEELLAPELRLSITVALEHFTAMMGELALTRDLFAEVDDEVRDLLMWHAAEEIEHKCVAFDVLEKTNPSYALRIRGLLLATLGLFSWWGIATRDLLAQDAEMFPRDDQGLSGLKERLARARDMWRAGIESGLLVGLAGAYLDYLRPGFHPSDRDNLELAKAYLAKAAPAA